MLIKFLPCSSRLTVNVYAAPLVLAGHLVNELHPPGQLVLAGRAEDVGGGQLEEVHAHLCPGLGLMTEQGQLVVLVHADHPLDVLLLDHLLGVLRPEGEGTEDNLVVDPVPPPSAGDPLHGNIVGQRWEKGHASEHWTDKVVENTFQVNHLKPCSLYLLVALCLV